MNSPQILWFSDFSIPNTRSALWFDIPKSIVSSVDGSIYFLTSESLTKFNASGTVIWKKIIKGNDLLSDGNNLFLTDGASLTKLNSDVLQEYVSKLVSQINMYIYYYKDASQLPEQLSMPTYTSMKGSRTLEYNTGFMSGNSTGASSYNEVGNII